MLIGSHETHPVADEFPLMDEADLAALAADIKANGLLRKIVLYQSRIIDGRNRYLACIRAGVEPEFREINDADIGDIVAFVNSENNRRRHVELLIRVLCEKRIYRHIRSRKEREKAQPTLMNVPTHTNEMVDSIADAEPELRAAFQDGYLDAAEAAEAAKLEPDAQRRFVEELIERSKEEEAKAAEETEAKAPSMSSETVELSGFDIIALRRGLAVWEQSSHGEVRAAAKLLRRIVPCL